MTESTRVTGNDPLLHDYLSANDHKEVTQHLETLVLHHACPIIDKTLQCRWCKACVAKASNGKEEMEREDLPQEVRLQLLIRLKCMRENGGGVVIGSFRGYVAGMAHRVCDYSLRKRFPMRCRLQERLRYALKINDSLAVWEVKEDVRLCGFVVWRNEVSVSASDRLTELLEHTRTFAPVILQGEDPHKLPLTDLLSRVFAVLGHPVEMFELVTLLADLLGQNGALPLALDADLANGLDPCPFDPCTRLHYRRLLEKLWSEVQSLPQRQRAAVLLNLRDAEGKGVIDLFPLLNLATIEDLAATLHISVDQLHLLWDDLPLDDATIAKHMHLTRQQVINLRQAARARLSRWVQGFEV